MANISFVDVFVPNASVDSMLNKLMTALVPVKNVRLERPNANTLVIHHRHVPDWAKVLGVIGAFFFLIGLVFFLVKTTETSTVYGRDVEGGAVFTVTGVTSADAYRVVNASLLPPPRRHAGKPRSRTREASGFQGSARPSEGRRSTATELERLAALHASGALEDDEFRRAKERLLGD